MRDRGPDAKQRHGQDEATASTVRMFSVISITTIPQSSRTRRFGIVSSSFKIEVAKRKSVVGFRQLGRRTPTLVSIQPELCDQARACLDLAQADLARAKEAAANSDKELMILMATAWMKLARQWQEHRSAFPPG